MSINFCFILLVIIKSFFQIYAHDVVSMTINAVLYEYIALANYFISTIYVE